MATSKPIAFGESVDTPLAEGESDEIDKSLA